MKALSIVVCCILIPASFAHAWGHDEHDIAQLNIYGPAATDQPHGVGITNEGSVKIETQTSKKTIAHMDNNRRAALESDIYAIFPTQDLVDQNPAAPFCDNQPTMDYNIIQPDKTVLTLIHYFHCHTYMATGPGVADKAPELKTLLDGVFSLTEFGN